MAPPLWGYSCWNFSIYQSLNKIRTITITDLLGFIPILTYVQLWICEKKSFVRFITQPSHLHPGEGRHWSPYHLTAHRSTAFSRLDCHQSSVPCNLRTAILICRPLETAILHCHGRKSSRSCPGLAKPAREVLRSSGQHTVCPRISLEESVCVGN
jgi:hypothetical protein